MKDARLSKREDEVAQWVVRGATNKDVASALDISEKTVEKHISHILRKLGFTSRAQLAVYMVAGRVPSEAPVRPYPAR